MSKAVSKEKRLEYDRRYREKNREKVNLRAREYREKNKEKRRLNAKEYREKNKEKIKEYNEQNKEKINESKAKWAAAHPENARKRVKRYKQRHREKVKAIHAKWCAEHREKRNEIGARYRENHRLEIREKAKQPANKQRIKEHCESGIEPFLKKAMRRIKRMYKKARHGPRTLEAQKKHMCGIDVNYLLSIWYKQEGKCAISGKHMIHKSNSPYTVSVDRIDSNVGYVEGNIQLLCQSINYAKNRFDNEQFLNFWKNEKEML